MTDVNRFTAELLEASASGYAAAAAAVFDREHEPGSSSSTAFAAARRAYLRQRVLELAAAVRVDEPEVFARRAVWLRRAAEARGLAERDLPHVLVSLREALREELPRHLFEVAAAPIGIALARIENPLEPDETGVDAATPKGRLTLRYLEACLATEPERAIGLILEAAGALSPEEIHVDVLAAAQREIGRLWHVGDVTVVEERLVSETTRRLLAILLHEHPHNEPPARTVIAASVSGDAHDIGLRIAANLYGLAGWRCVFLGADVPSEQLARAVAMLDPDLVMLTATLATQLNDVWKAIRQIREASESVRVLVGGAAFEGGRELWRQMGADGYAATIADAVATGNALVEGAAS
jgi:MerR family transcriptional regulator, light-induced transcriptional regulator